MKPPLYFIGVVMIGVGVFLAHGIEAALVCAGFLVLIAGFVLWANSQ